MDAKLLYAFLISVAAVSFKLFPFLVNFLNARLKQIMTSHEQLKTELYEKKNSLICIEKGLSELATRRKNFAKDCELSIQKKMDVLKAQHLTRVKDYENKRVLEVREKKVALLDATLDKIFIDLEKDMRQRISGGVPKRVPSNDFNLEAFLRKFRI